MKNAPAVHHEERLRRCEECAGAHNDEGRKPFGLRPSLSPAAIYSRGTYRPTTIDVLMFHFRVRNGTGWGHQAMTTGLLIYFVFRSSYFSLPVCHVAAGCFFGGDEVQTDIRVAVCMFCVEFHVESSLSPGVIHLGCV